MNKHYYQYPSISKILKTTESEESKEALARWAANIGEREAERIRTEAINRGKLIDSNVAEYFVTQDCGNEIIKGYLSQYRIIANEEDCYSDTYKYFGRFDNLLVRNDKVILNDFKGSGKPKQKQWLNDNPIQLSAYYFALNEMKRPVDYAQLSYLVDGEKEVQKFVFSKGELEGYFKEFVKRLEQYQHLLLTSA